MIEGFEGLGELFLKKFPKRASPASPTNQNLKENPPTVSGAFDISEEYVFKGKEDCEDIHNRGDVLPLFAYAVSFTHRDF